MRLAVRPVTPRDERLVHDAGAGSLDPTRGDLGVLGHLGGDVRGETVGVATLAHRDPAAPELAVRVTQGHRGRGVGRALLRALLGDARAAGVATVVLPATAADPAERLHPLLGGAAAEAGSPDTLVARIAPRAAVLDLDDTLLDHRGASSRAVRAFAVDHGLPEAGAPGRWHRLTARHYDRYQRREIGLDEHRRLRVREFLVRPDLSDEEADLLFADYQRRYQAGWTAYADALPALEAARAAGLGVGVLTNGEQQMQTEKLRRTGLLGHVDAVVASSELPAAKPDPRAFAAAAERLGVSVTELVMVGDSLTHDVHGARAAGADAVLLDRRQRHHVAARTGVRRVTTLADIVWPQVPPPDSP